MYESNVPKLNEVILIPVTISDFKAMIREVVHHEIQEHLKVSVAPKEVKPFKMTEAAEYLGITKPTLYGYVHDGKLKPFKPGKSLFFSKESLDRYLRGELPASADPNEYLGRIKKKNFS